MFNIIIIFLCSFVFLQPVCASECSLEEFIFALPDDSDNDQKLVAKPKVVDHAKQVLLESYKTAIATSVSVLLTALTRQLGTPIGKAETLRSARQLLKDGKMRKFIVYVNGVAKHVGIHHEVELIDPSAVPEFLKYLNTDQRRPLSASFRDHDKQLAATDDAYERELQDQTPSKFKSPTRITRARGDLVCRILDLVSEKKAQSPSQLLVALHDYVENPASPEHLCVKKRLALAHRFNVATVPTRTFPLIHVVHGNTAGGRHLFTSKQDLQDGMISICTQAGRTALKNSVTGVMAGLVAPGSGLHPKFSSAFPLGVTADDLAQFAFHDVNIYAQRSSRFLGGELLEHLLYSIPGRDYLVQAVKTKEVSFETIYPIFSHTELTAASLDNEELVVELCQWENMTTGATGRMQLPINQLKQLLKQSMENESLRDRCIAGFRGEDHIVIDLAPHALIPGLDAGLCVEVPLHVFDTAMQDTLRTLRTV